MSMVQKLKRNRIAREERLALAMHVGMHRRKKSKPNVCFAKTNEPTGLHVLGPNCRSLKQLSLDLVQAQGNGPYLWAKLWVKI